MRKDIYKLLNLSEENNENNKIINYKNILLKFYLNYILGDLEIKNNKGLRIYYYNDLYDLTLNTDEYTLNRIETNTINKTENLTFGLKIKNNEVNFNILNGINLYKEKINLLYEYNNPNMVSELKYNFRIYDGLKNLYMNHHFHSINSCDEDLINEYIEEESILPDFEIIIYTSYGYVQYSVYYKGMLIDKNNDTNKIKKDDTIENILSIIKGYAINLFEKNIVNKNEQTHLLIK